MSGGSLELTSIPSTYNVRHKMANHKRISIASVFEECVIRVASWSDTEAPVVVRVQPGTTQHELANWARMYPGRNVEDGKPEITYRAARGADGIVRLVTPVLGLGKMTGRTLDTTLDIDAIERMTGCVHLDYPGSVYCPNRSQRASLARLDTIVHSERNAAIACSLQKAGQIVLVDGTLMMPCAEPGWICEPIGASLRLYAGSNPTDQGTNLQVDFIPATTDLRRGIGTLGLGYDTVPIHTTGTISTTAQGIIGLDPAWGMLYRLAEHALYDYDEVKQGMTFAEMELRNKVVHALYQWPGTRDAEVVEDVSRLIRIVYSVMPNNHACTMKSLLAVEQEMARIPIPANLEDRLGAAGIRPGRPQEQPIVRI